LTFEPASGDWIVLDANAGVVLRASGPAAHVLTGIAVAGAAPGAERLPAHLDDTVAALAERGVIVASTNTDTNTGTVPDPTDINGAAPGMSRRRLIGTGALAAGAATVATTTGIHTLVLPTAAAAASVTLAAPTSVTATPADGSISVSWTAVGGATTYQPYFKLTSQDASNWVTFGGPVAASPVAVTGLSGTVSYDFYVVAIAGATQSAPSDPVTATAIGGAGITWTARTTAANINWDSVTYGLVSAPTPQPVFVAIVSGLFNGVVTSPDGITWTDRTAAANNIWSSVTYGNGLFVAVARAGPSTGDRVMTSPNGIDWTIGTTPADNDWTSVAYGNGRFVAVSGSGTGNQAMTSTDGTTWTIGTTPAGSWNSVTYGNGVFVAVASADSIDGSGNRVMTSPDGTTWTTQTAAANNDWYGVTYGNGLFVAVSINGTGNRVMTSPNGTTWTTRTSAADNDWYGVIYGNGLFVAVAQSGSGNRVMTSPNGTTWTTRTSAADNGWRSVTYGNGRFVAVAVTGGSERVMTSP